MTTSKPTSQRHSAATNLKCALRGAVLWLSLSAALAQGPFIQYDDPAYDVLSRSMDLGGTTPYDLDLHRSPNLLSIRIGRWQATQAHEDLFVGVFAGNGAFLRLDLTLAGVINPPGKNEPLDFDPFRYGPNPIYGFIELDVDHEKETGGELDAPEFRYLTNAARFGGLPSSNVFDDRLARRSSEIDASFTSDPYIERSGEEFHLALLGGQFQDLDITEKTGNGNLIFEAGEDWRIVGEWLHRAHGFERYSFAYGGVVPGEYLPYSVARFSHNNVDDTTTITLVVPMTNTGAAVALGLPPEQAEPYDSDTSNQTSIAEALDDLELSAELVEHFPTGEPEEILITGWDDINWYEFLDPRDWRLTALLGTSYTAPGAYFVWTDIYPNVVRGDVNGGNVAGSYDRSKIESFINDYDAEDGVMDDAVELTAIGESFDVFDVSYDGVVDELDIMLVSPPGDLDSDDDVDIWDLAMLQTCQGPIGGTSNCILSDINGDETTDIEDVNWILSTFSGPLP